MLDLWSLPGPRDFLDRAMQALEEGASLVVGNATQLPPDFWVELCERARSTVGGRQSRLGDTDRRAGSSPAETLARHLARDPDVCGPVLHDLLDPLTGLGLGLFWIEAPALASEPAWITFLQEFAHAARSVMTWTRPRLVVTTDTIPRQLQPDVTLRYQPWGEEVTDLDVALLTGSLISPASRSTAAAAGRHLKVQLVVELAARNLDHAAALAAQPLASLLERDTTAATKAVWRAQLRVIFPLLEERRIAIIVGQEDQLRSGLPLTTDAGTVHDPFDLEWGPLVLLLRRGAPAYIRQEAERWRSWRNRLAHLQKLSFAELAEGRELIDPRQL